MMDEIELTVPSPGGERLDVFVARGLSASRARVKSAFELGEVRVDGRRARKGDRTVAGTRVRVRLPDEPGAPVPEPELPLSPVREDGWLVAVDKPPGVATHPLRPGERGTLANAVSARYPECAAAGDEPREGGACHRLDRETSGLVLFARKREAYEHVRRELSLGRAEKIYLGLVNGEPEAEGRCELPLASKGDGAPRVGPLDGRPARTSFRRLATSGGFSLLEVRIETGVRYQIRAHLAALGFPLAGDAVYGGGEAPAALGRHLLHANRLSLEHPAGGRFEAMASLPEDARRCLVTLGFELGG
ncbi:MAG: RluA family pseudouridine synthase [Deltaproteobacteria bacterium]